MLDCVLRNGIVFDGTGGPGVVADVGIQDGKVAAIGAVHETGHEEVDVAGWVVCPGFLDVHTHSDLALLEQPECTPKVTQGVTTEILGNCGFSVFPMVQTKSMESFRQYSGPVLGFTDRKWNWQSYTDYVEHVKAAAPGVNYASLMGHSTLRCAVMGFENRRPTNAEMEKMKLLLSESLQHGALGLSTGLVYTPGAYAQTEELVELARVVAKFGGVYATHLRNQADGLVDSVKEAIEIAERSGVAVHISHHKTVGEKNQGLVHQTLALLDDANHRGLSISSDMYPYLAGSTTLTSVLPGWLMEGGIASMLSRLQDPQLRSKAISDIESGIPGWENRLGALGYENVIISFVRSARNQRFQGKNLTTIAQQRGENPIDCVFNLLTEESGVVGVILQNSTEADLKTVLVHEKTVIGSDGLYAGEKPHPRLYGTFPRFVHNYVTESKALSLSLAIRKMTSLAAEIFHIDDVGKIELGYRADLVVLNPETIRDAATFENPTAISEGIQHVLVGGRFALRDGRLTDQRNGQFLHSKGVRQ
ncbi:D-aminoacylase [Alicyclobacillus tolerans]|uniref:N-acyl-D-amino-acid deacylase family protein n=1 Tax=Alicyclobacillus tolerans TaxID=90970 RepID=UPI001F1CE03E|nr:D-aminoacylase [Alicyclobacillus tolerans]MCF8565724.1 D-aminoacylase [Alicyclobacillus tolerans]